MPAHISKLLQAYSILVWWTYTVCALPRPVDQTTETARVELLQTQKSYYPSLGVVSNCSSPCGRRSHDIRSDATEGGIIERRVVTNSKKTTAFSQKSKAPSRTNKPPTPRTTKKKVDTRARSKGKAPVGRPDNSMTKGKKGASKSRATPKTKGHKPSMSKKKTNVEGRVAGKISTSRTPKNKKGVSRSPSPKSGEKRKGGKDVGPMKTTMSMARPKLIRFPPFRPPKGVPRRVALSAVALNFDYTGDDNY